METMKTPTIKNIKPHIKRWTTAEVAENIRLMNRTEAKLQAELADAQGELSAAQAAESSTRETAKAVSIEDEDAYYKAWDAVWKTSGKTWDAQKRVRAAQAALEAKRMDDKAMNLDQSMRDIYVGISNSNEQMNALRTAQKTELQIRQIARDAVRLTINPLEAEGKALENARTTLAHIESIESLAKAAEKLLEEIDRAIERPHTKDDLIALIKKLKEDPLAEKLRETYANGGTLPISCYGLDIYPNEYHAGYAFEYPEDRIPDEIQRIDFYAPENTSWTNRFHEYCPPIWAEIEWPFERTDKDDAPRANIQIKFPGRWNMPDLKEI